MKQKINIQTPSMLESRIGPSPPPPEFASPFADERENLFLRQLYPISGIILNVITTGCVLGWQAENPVTSSDNPVSVSQIRKSKNDNSLPASIIALGMLNGNVILPFLLNKCGRNLANTFASFLSIISGLLIYLSPEFWSLAVGRYVQCLLMGIQVSVVMFSTLEYAGPCYRNIFVSFLHFSLPAGMLICHLCHKLVSWRNTNLVGSSFVLVSVFIFLTSPESPFYLAWKKRFKECRDSFHWLRGKMNDEEELLMLLKTYGGDTTRNRSSWYLCCVDTYKLSKKPIFYKPMSLLVVLFMMNQWTGVAVIPNLMPDIFSYVTRNRVSHYTGMIITDCVRLLASVGAALTMHFFKIRTTFFLSCAFSLISSLFTAIYIHMGYLGYTSFQNPFIPMSTFIAYIYFVHSSINYVPYMLLGELFPMNLKPLGGFCCGFFMTALRYILIEITYPFLVKQELFVTFYIFSAVIASLSPILWFKLPETKGKPLVEIMDLYKTDSERRDTSSQQSANLITIFQSDRVLSA